MEGIIKIVLERGPWVLLVGIITSIIIGLVKTPIRKAAIKESLDAKVKQRRETIFDVVVFLSTFVMAFLGAMVYYLIVNKVFVILDILSLVPSIWLAQSMVYGIWKKLGLKKLLNLLLKLFIRDKNKDGKISLDEAISMVKDAYKNGKLDVDELLKGTVENVTENLEGVLSEATQEVEVTESMEAVKSAAEGDYSQLGETIKDATQTLIKQPENAPEAENVEVAKPNSTIKF